jgi:hypothetical protein
MSLIFGKAHGEIDEDVQAFLDETWHRFASSARCLVSGVGSYLKPSKCVGIVALLCHFVFPWPGSFLCIPGESLSSANMASSLTPPGLNDVLSVPELTDLRKPCSKNHVALFRPTRLRALAKLSLAFFIRSEESEEG